jgi:hypothetical protein
MKKDQSRGNNPISLNLLMFIKASAKVAYWPFFVKEKDVSISAG